jgi:hypothetical protein
VQTGEGASPRIGEQDGDEGARGGRRVSSVDFSLRLERWNLKNFDFLLDFVVCLFFLALSCYACSIMSSIFLKKLLTEYPI